MIDEWWVNDRVMVPHWPDKPPRMVEKLKGTPRHTNDFGVWIFRRLPASRIIHMIGWCLG
jgi:hypothetical protein